MTPYSLIFAPEDAGKRLDRALAEYFPEFSRARLQGLIAEGQISIDGKPEASASRKVRGGESVSLLLPDPVAAAPIAQKIPLTILFEDEHVIVLDKPAGLVVHPSHGHETGTLVNALLGHCGDTLSGINGVLRPGIVHRLDKDTSGLMVVTKNGSRA